MKRPTYPHTYVPSLFALAILLVLWAAWPLRAQEAADSPATAVAPNATASDGVSTETRTMEIGPEFPADEGEGLRLNFRGVPLDTVLEYLSKAGGFTVIRNASVSGTVDVFSHQPLSKDEAVTLLNTVLNEKGYAAVRNDRFLLIVTRDEAIKRNIPVRSGNEPEAIPRNDEMVTQIIPVLHANASQLLDNLKPLLPSYAVVSANESSNAIILTDTQTSVRRMTEIIKTLDSSISGISTLRVIVLRYADATATAETINNLFESDSSGSNAVLNQIRRSRRGFGGPFGPPQSDSENQSNDSPARQAASRVLAVADERMNAVVVSAPEEAIPTIEDLVRQLDVDTDEVTEVRVFPLRYANAEETAEIVTDMFQDAAKSLQVQNQSGGRRNPLFGFGNRQQSSTSQRQVSENAVVAVADTRTNSVIVSAGSERMSQVERIIAGLDANPAKAQGVRVYSIQHANPEDVAAILQEMFQKQGATTSNTNGSSASGSSSSTSSGSSSQSGRGGSSSNQSGNQRN
ncbi:hypothetical protein JW916_02335 [Candidatus Sumerlaeota bacterium]|nr:hypothetical protein [Candidatus Sumerlaeota bacterium]